jgi:hypothetical protein
MVNWSWSSACEGPKIAWVPELELGMYAAKNCAWGESRLAGMMLPGNGVSLRGS